jgi:protein-disulfide isomerase/rhodanese-related sulfurtransferase
MRKGLAFIAVLVGLFASAYLTWSYTSSVHRMVCLGTGCDEVRASRFAHLWGLPLPIYGLVFYLLLAALLLAESCLPRQRKWLWRLLLLLTAGGVLFSGWLTGLEAFVIHAWCEWCVTQALAVSLAFVLTLTIIVRPPAAEARPAWRSRLALLALALVVGGPALALIIRRESRQEQPVLSAAGKAVLIEPDSHTTGPENAPVTIVEFGDFQCPSCGVAEETNRAIRNQYEGRVRFVFRQFPLPAMHAFALPAAKASECAAEQGQFWPMAETLYANQSDLRPEALTKYAAQAGLEASRFGHCMAGPAAAARVQRDIADGKALGVRATPTFFVNGRKIEGGLSVLDIEAALHPGSPARAGSARAGVDEGSPARAGSARAGVDAPKPAESAKSSTPAAPSRADTRLEQAAGKRVTTPAVPEPGGGAQASQGMAAATAPPFGLGPGSGKPNLFAPAKQSSAIVPCGINDAPVEDPPLIHLSEARKLFDERAAVPVDVRDNAAFKTGHIPAAINATVDQLDKATPPDLPKNKPIVLYEAGGADESCATSRTAGRILMQKGFKEVKVFKEGLEGWKKEGLPVAR